MNIIWIVHEHGHVIRRQLVEWIAVYSDKKTYKFDPDIFIRLNKDDESVSEGNKDVPSHHRCLSHDNL